MLISYIHGFLSGSAAVKARQLREYLRGRPGMDFSAPDFPDTPREAWQALCAFCDEAHAAAPGFCLVGSSMGGFFATLLQCRYGCPVALINPCVHPQDYFASLVGPHVNPVTGTHFELRHDMLDFLAELDRQAADYLPGRTLVLLQSGDEVLDYRRALDFYARSTIVLSEGGCHAYENFPERLESIVEFFAAVQGGEVTPAGVITE